jgi:hypothetical protein
VLMYTTRSARVALPIQITYRLVDDDHWISSRVVNISESGMLFGPTALAPGTPVEVLFSMPMDVGMLASGKQICVAEVVRTTETGAAAVKFEECRYILDA